MVRDIPEARRRRIASERFADALHETMIRGPEGEQESRDEKGKRIKSGIRTEYKGYQEYLERLQLVSLGASPREVELAEEMKRLESTFDNLARFFGHMRS